MRLRRKTGAVIAGSILLLGGGCTIRHAPPTVLPSASTGRPWRIGLKTVPARPQQLDPTQFLVRIKDSSGRPLTGAAVSVQLTMPSMDMGRNAAAAKEVSPPGTYAATGRFTMPGDWQITVQARRGQTSQSQSFSRTAY